MKCGPLRLLYTFALFNNETGKCSERREKRLTGAMKYFKFHNKTDFSFSHTRTPHIHAIWRIGEMSVVASFTVVKLCVNFSEKHHQNSLYDSCNHNKMRNYDVKIRQTVFDSVP